MGENQAPVSKQADVGWVSHRRGRNTRATETLAQLIETDDQQIMVGDLMMLELLQGALRVVPMLKGQLTPKPHPVTPARKKALQFAEPLT